MKDPNNHKWHIFDRGWSDKLLSTDVRGDGILDTDVLIRRTPWTGGPATKEDHRYLIDLAEAAFIPHERAEIEFTPMA